ncbi:MAG: retropepsin-like domain-containing protein, partial [Acetobacteraceae bacterium]|nr:retropepsin-like domain-containing protein [Acetobacteraceae bacterium]
QTGATGRTAPRPLAQLRRVRLGSFELADHMVAVINRPGMIGPDGNPPQLILGGDILTRHDIDLDLPGRRMTLHTARVCRLEAPPLPGPTYELPMRSTRNHIVTDIEVNGVASDAILDTGANLHFLSRPRALSLGITAAELAAAPQRGVRGINNEVQNLAVVTLRTLRIGPETMRDVPVMVGEGAPADCVIGTPWLAFRRLFVSYANLRLFVMAAAPAAA